MDSTASDPQPQQQPHQNQQQQQHHHHQQPPPPQQQQPQPPPPQQQQHQSQHPSKPQAQTRPQQHQQQSQQIQQQQPTHQHPQHAHQGQPQAAQAAFSPMAPQYPSYQYARYQYAPYATAPYPTYNYPPWTQPANFSPAPPQSQYAPNMVNPQPNVPHNRPSSQTIINAGYNIDRTHNQGLQVNVINRTMTATAKPLVSRPRQVATLKTPDGIPIKLDDASSTSKNPSTTTTTPTTTKATPATNTTGSAEHVHTFLQKVSEDTVDSKKSGTEGGKAAEEKNRNDVAVAAVANDKKKSVDPKIVGDKKDAPNDRKQPVDNKKAEFDKSAEVNKTNDKEDKENKIVEDKKTADDKKADDKFAVVADKNVLIEKVNEDPKKDASKMMDEDSAEKENKIQIQETNEITKQAEPEKSETVAASVQEDKVDPAKEEVEDDGKGKDDAETEDESSNSLKYEPGQYHPVTNKSGKKKYSRDFLMSIRDRVGKAEHITFPQDLIKADFFFPGFGMTTHIPSRQNDSNRRQGQNNYSGRSSAGQEKQRIVITSVSLTQEVELKTSSNPWRPAKEVKKEEEAPEVVDTELLKKKFRSILNKLTPNNFDNLAQSVTSLNIDTESKLGDVIDIVFAKALAEPGYCVLYGQMCSLLKKNTADGATFGNTLLKRCQHQFQSDIYSGLNLDERKKKIEDEQDPALKKQLEEELYEDMYRCRMRGLGLIKFIGELYKIEMLNDAIMYDCVLRLLSDGAEEALECLCDLLATIGEKLDTSTKQKANVEKEKSKTKGAQKSNPYQSGQKLSAVVASGPQQQKSEPTLDSVFEQLQKMHKNPDLPLSKRIRFKLLDTCELREKDRWHSKRTKDNNPKKLDEIRKAHEEKLEQEKRQNAMGPRRSQEHRRLGHSGGSSNHISSLANESDHRGNLHTSASSHLLRDRPMGDMKSNHNSGSEDFQANLGQFKRLEVLKNQSLNKDKQTSLRPVSRLTSGLNKQQ